jgi:hypothetical protein
VLEKITVSGASPVPKAGFMVKPAIKVTVLLYFE